MKFSEETLMAYADNELDAKTRTAVEAAVGLRYPMIGGLPPAARGC